MSTRWLERETEFFVTISDTSFENNKDKWWIYKSMFINYNYGEYL